MDKNVGLPSLRFKGFNETWEQCRLDELGTIVTGSTPSTAISEYYSSDGIPWVTPTDISENITINTSRKLSVEGQKISRIVPKNTILVTCIASIGKNTLLGSKGSFNQQINGLIPKENNDPYFLYSVSSHWSQFIKRMGGGLTFQIVNKTEFSRVLTYAPKYDEQKKIGSIFGSIDNLITLHQRKYEKLINVKKSLLGRMFPQNGSHIPQIRFKGFNETWEQCKLGDLTNITTGKLDANAMDVDGKYDFYTSGVQKYRINSYSFDGPAITIAGNGATVGHMYLANGKFDAYQRTYVLTEFRADRKFIYYSVGKALPKKIFEEARKGNIPYIVMDMLTDLYLKTPEKTEQDKIGSVFRSLDNLITLHQRKHKKLTNIKKALLQKMFV